MRRSERTKPIIDQRETWEDLSKPKELAEKLTSAVFITRDQDRAIAAINAGDDVFFY